MEPSQVYWLVLVIVGSQAAPDQLYSLKDRHNGQNVVSDKTASVYNVGVHMGIINPEKYSLESFKKDENNIFKDLFKEYVSLNGSQPINYQEWLILNNFGILPDTQQSLFDRKISKRSTSTNKKNFMNTVKTGDILITGRGSGGIIGHAAIMTSDYWVLEMPGGSGWATGIPSNNQQIDKDKWFDKHASDWTTVYRCPDNTVARQAASWADRTYYNPNGGAKKTKHITYMITSNLHATNPSYCSKLVVQAYYFGTGSKKVINNLPQSGGVIVPSTIPTYFLSPYRLTNKGRY